MPYLVTLILTLTAANRDQYLIDHFKYSDFACKDGSKVFLVHPKILILTEVLRRVWDRPIIITSAYRTPQHNEDVGGSETSFHLVGEAIDFLLPKNDKFEFVDLCEKIFPFCIANIYRGYVHCDLGKRRHGWEDV